MEWSSFDRSLFNVGFMRSLFAEKIWFAQQRKKTCAIGTAGEKVFRDFVRIGHDFEQLLFTKKC